MVNIIVPEWLSHRGKKNRRAPITSLHVHPCLEKLVTASVDQSIRIWNIERKVLFNESAHRGHGTAAASHLRLLSTIGADRTNGGTVMCIRFSNDTGQYIAASTDDQRILILAPDYSGRGTFGTHNIENWRLFSTLTGHKKDVISVEWGPRNQYLGSASLDGTVIIWNVEDGFTKHKVIDTGHWMCRGLVWDPVEKYFAVHVQSEDHHLRVYRTSDWGLESTVRAPFQNAREPSMFARLSWSPDAQMLVGVNSVSGVVNTAVVVQRGKWPKSGDDRTDDEEDGMHIDREDGKDNDGEFEDNNDDYIHFVGHLHVVGCAKFNPHMYRAAPTPLSPTESEPYVMLAVASADALSFFNSTLQRSLGSIIELFRHEVTDMCWTPDGSTLFASSYDGTVAAVVFDEGELGIKVTESEVMERLGALGFRRGEGKLVAEDVSVVQLESERKEKSKLANEKLNDRLTAAGLDGKDAQEGFTSQALGNQQSVNILQPQPAVNMFQSQPTTQPAPTIQQLPPKPPQSPSITNQVTTIAKDGRKRIQPTFISTLDEPAPGRATPVPSTQSALIGTIGARCLQQVTATASNIRQSTPVGTGIGIPNIGTLPIDLVTPCPSLLDTHTPIQSQRQSIVIPNNIALKDNEGLRIQIRNHPSRKTSDLHFLRSDGEVLWTDRLPSRISCVAFDPNQISDSSLPSTSSRIVAACEDCSLIVYSKLGRRVFPPMVLPAIPRFLDLEEKDLLIIDSNGFVHVWDLEKPKLCVSVSCYPVLKRVNAARARKADTQKEISGNDTQTNKSAQSLTCIYKASIKNGTPILTLNDGSSYAFNRDLGTWCYVLLSGEEVSGDANQGVMKELRKSARDAVTVGRARNAAAKSTGVGGTGIEIKLGRARETDISWLETAIAASNLVNSKHEYLHYLRLYAQRIADEGNVLKVQELCEDLCNDNQIMGRSRMEILAELIPILATSRSIQRVYLEYKTRVDEWKKANRNSSGMDVDL